MTPSKSELTTISSVAQLLAVVLTVTSLFFARDVFIPLALGLLLSFLLSPIVNRLQRLGIPNVAAVIATAMMAFILLASGFTLIGRELTTLVGDLPMHKDELLSKARSVAGMTTGMGGALDKLAEEVTEAIETDPGESETEVKAVDKTVFGRWATKLLPDPETLDEATPNNGTSAKSPLYVTEIQDSLPLASWATTAGTVLGPLVTAGLVTVFALFMLIHREDLRDRIIAVVSHGNYVTTTEALDEAAGRISRYLIAQTIVNTSYGLVLTIGLAIIGGTMTDQGAFPNVILWGVLATCLRYVPYLGPTASAIFPLAFALSVFPGYRVFLAVLSLIVVMELLSNNILEPWLYGASTGISAVAVILAAVFWGWLWGPVGLLLSTPLTVCLVVLGRYVPRFKMLATLLSEQIEIKTSLRFYQRLLASDEHRAKEMLFAFADEKGFDHTCHEVLVPVLKRIRNDHDSEYLTDADANRLFAMVGGLNAELHDHVLGDQEITNGLPTVIACNSHHFSETLVMNLLRTGGHGLFQLDTMNDETLPQEVGEHVLLSNPAAVVIAVLPKGGFAQARYLCKSIRTAGYSGPILIACFGKFKEFDKLFVRFRKAGANSMTTSYPQTKSKLNSIIVQQDRIKSHSEPIRTKVQG